MNRRCAWINRQGNRYFLLRCKSRDEPHARLARIFEIGVGPIQIHFPCTDLCDVEQVVDQGQKMMSAFGDGIDRLRLLVRQATVHAFAERFRKSKNCVEWCAQFMTHRRQKIVFRLHDSRELRVRKRQLRSPIRDASLQCYVQFLRFAQRDVCVLLQL